MKKLYLLGHPVGHSKSPVMHNAAYARLGLPWEYEACDLPTGQQAEDFLASRDYFALNITTPYKPQAYAAADVKAASAQLAHGVNLVANQLCVLMGFNVDCQGAVRVLEREGVCFMGA